MRPRSRIQTTGPNNGHQLRDYSKSSNRSESPLIYRFVSLEAYYGMRNIHFKIDSHEGFYIYTHHIFLFFV